MNYHSGDYLFKTCYVCHGSRVFVSLLMKRCKDTRHSDMR